MLNKVIYDPYHTHIGLVRPGSAPAGTRPPTHKQDPLQEADFNLKPKPHPVIVATISCVAGRSQDTIEGACSCWLACLPASPKRYGLCVSQAKEVREIPHFKGAVFC